MTARKAFSLIELLVVIAIIAVLAAILFPVFASAKRSAKGVVSLNNLKQIGLAVMMYEKDAHGYPMHSSPSSASPRTRWPDYVYPYVKSEEIFVNPLAGDDLKSKKWAHDQASVYGGYGYNYQYLGNSRLPWSACDSDISNPADTVAVAETMGVRKDGRLMGGAYVVDPPLPSDRGSGKPSGYYADGDDCGAGPTGCRSHPGVYAFSKVTVAFADGHAKGVAPEALDDYNGDGQPDNGWFNGSGRSDQR